MFKLICVFITGTIGAIYLFPDSNWAGYVAFGSIVTAWVNILLED